MTPRQEFEQIFRENITREGADRLLEWLQKTDFFLAPASTRYHNAFEGGLVQHSVNVYKVFMQKHFDEETDSRESFAICGLLHDVCKVNLYVRNTRNVKNEATGQWEKVPYYSVGENKFPYGHGEASVWLIQRFMRLNVEESLAIRWHMGGFDDAAKGYDLSAAFRQFPNAMLLHIADMKATYLLDK